MGRRRTLTETRVHPAPTLPSPNATRAAITVEIRAAWPPYSGNIPALLALLDDAYTTARARIESEPDE